MHHNTQLLESMVKVVPASPSHPCGFACWTESHLWWFPLSTMLRGPLDIIASQVHSIISLLWQKLLTTICIHNIAPDRYAMCYILHVTPTELFLFVMPHHGLATGYTCPPKRLPTPLILDTWEREVRSMELRTGYSLAPWGSSQDYMIALLCRAPWSTRVTVPPCHPRGQRRNSGSHSAAASSSSLQIHSTSSRGMFIVTAKWRSHHHLVASAKIKDR